MEMPGAQLQPSRANLLGIASAWSTALPFFGAARSRHRIPLFGGGYWGLIATRACVYWVLVSGLNLVVGFAGQIAIGWVALLTLGAYATSVLAARQCHAGLPSLSGAGDCGHDWRRLRPDPWSAGASAAHLLFRHHHSWLRDYRHSGGAGFAAKRYRRRRWRCRSRFSRHHSPHHGASIISASAWRRSAPG